jgi:hypothetical protein
MYSEEIITIEEALSLSHIKIKENIKYAIQHDLFSEIIIYVSNKMNLKEHIYFFYAIQYSQRIFQYLLCLYPDFNFFNFEIWNYVFKFSDTNYIDKLLTLYEKHKYKDQLPTIDSIVASNFFQNNNSCSILQKFLKLGSKIQNIKKVISHIIHSETYVQFFIQNNICTHENILDYYIPCDNQTCLYYPCYTYPYCQQLEKIYRSDNIIPIFKKYNIFQNFCPYSTKNKIYKIIHFALQVENLNLVHWFYENGFPLKHEHFIHFNTFKDVTSHVFSYIIKTYKPNQYNRWIKTYFFYLNNLKIHKAHDLKCYDYWRYFFFVWEKRLEKFKRFKNLHEMKTIILNYRQEYFNTIKYHLNTQFSDDILNFCILPYLS